MPKFDIESIVVYKQIGILFEPECFSHTYGGTMHHNRKKRHVTQVHPISAQSAVPVGPDAAKFVLCKQTDYYRLSAPGEIRFIDENLTVGKVYQVLSPSYTDFFRIQNDKGKEEPYPKYIFDIVQPELRVIGTPQVIAMLRESVIDEMIAGNPNLIREAIDPNTVEIEGKTIEFFDRGEAVPRKFRIAANKHLYDLYAA